MNRKGGKGKGRERERGKKVRDWETATETENEEGEGEAEGGDGGSGRDSRSDGLSQYEETIPAIESPTPTRDLDLEPRMRQEYDKYYEALEMLIDKKAALRLKGLQQVLQVLQSGGTENFPTDSIDSLNSNLTKLIRRPVSTTEGVEAIKVLSVVGLILGTNDTFVESFSPLLTHIITRVEDDVLRQEALKSLAFIHYVSSSNQSESSAWILCEEILLQTSEGLEVPIVLRSCALKCWCLLASVIHPELVLQHSRDGVFEAAIEILDDADTEGKVIAAGCFAFLWEVAYNQNTEGDAAAWEEMLCDNTRDCERAIAIITRIGKESSKKIAKKEKKERKGVMRMVLEWITEGISPEETLELRGTELEISTFASLQQIDVLREVLGDGFQSCLRSFPATRSILDVDYLPDTMMKDDLDAKARHAFNERQRSGYRKQDRRDKAHAYSATHEEW